MTTQVTWLLFDWQAFRDNDNSIDAFLIVYSVTDRSSFSYAQTCLQEAARRQQRRTNIDSVVVLVANKQDLVRNRVVSTSGTNTTWIAEFDKRITKYFGVLYYVQSTNCCRLQSRSQCSLTGMVSCLARHSPESPVSTWFSIDAVRQYYFRLSSNDWHSLMMYCDSLSVTTQWNARLGKQRAIRSWFTGMSILWRSSRSCLSSVLACHLVAYRRLHFGRVVFFHILNTKYSIGKADFFYLAHSISFVSSFCAIRAKASVSH